MISRGFESSPFLSKFVKTIWSKNPDCFIWMSSSEESENFVCRSGIVPQSYSLGNLITKFIPKATYTQEVDEVKSNSIVREFLQERKNRLPENVYMVSSFGALCDPEYSIEHDALTLAIDILFLIGDIPLISGCLKTALRHMNAIHFSNLKLIV